MVRKLAEEEEKADDNSTDSSKNKNQENNTIDEVESYDHELLQETELIPPYTRAIETIGSKFKIYFTWANIPRYAS